MLAKFQESINTGVLRLLPTFEGTGCPREKYTKKSKLALDKVI
jgi:hypothetical protein